MVGSVPTWPPVSSPQHHYQPPPSCPFSHVRSLLILQVLRGLDISLNSLGRSPPSRPLCRWPVSSSQTACPLEAVRCLLLTQDPSSTIGISWVPQAVMGQFCSS